MKKGLFWLLTLIMVSTLILVGWSEDVTASQATAKAPSSIKIGALISLTGYDAWAGQPLKRGYEMAVEKINNYCNLS